jgi:hypothetical protein
MLCSTTSTSRRFAPVCSSAVIRRDSMWAVTCFSVPHATACLRGTAGPDRRPLLQDQERVVEQSPASRRTDTGRRTAFQPVRHVPVRWPLPLPVAPAGG